MGRDIVVVPGECLDVGRDRRYRRTLLGSSPTSWMPLRLAGPEPDSVETKGFSVSEAVQNGSLLTLQRGFLIAKLSELTVRGLLRGREPRRLTPSVTTRQHPDRDPLGPAIEATLAELGARVAEERELELLLSDLV
ncbi:hypothetical protein GCM10009536_17460 [Streptomyces thermocarboxydus]